MTILKMLNLGGISSVIRSEIKFYSYTHKSPETKFLIVYPPMKILSTVIVQRVSI